MMVEKLLSFFGDDMFPRAKLVYDVIAILSLPLTSKESVRKKKKTVSDWDFW